MENYDKGISVMKQGLLMPLCFWCLKVLMLDVAFTHTGLRSDSFFRNPTLIQQMPALKLRLTTPNSACENTIGTVITTLQGKSIELIWLHT